MNFRRGQELVVSNPKPVHQRRPAYGISVESNAFGDPDGTERQENTLHPSQRGWRDGGFTNVDAQGPAELQHHRPGYAGQNAAGQRRRANRLVLDPEEIAACSFDDISSVFKSKASSAPAASASARARICESLLQVLN